MLARRIQQIGFSPTLGINDLARRLRSQGLDVLDFSAGEPDLPTPEAVKQAGVRAIEENRTRYTATAGLVELREAIAARIHRDLGVDYKAEQILVSPGAKASLYFACMALFDVGDEVLVPAPYWPSYPEQIRLAGAEPVFVRCAERNGFKLTADQLEAAAGSRTKALILNYPSNPTGVSYTREELEPLARLCVDRGIWIIADEIYSKLLYDGRHFTSVAQLGSEVLPWTLLIDGMSKAYSMTGWRVGYAAGPSELISGMAKLQSHSTSNVASMSQWASVRALELNDEDLAPRLREFERRRELMLGRLHELPGVSCVEPAGAFYAFPNVSGCFRAVPGGPAVGSGEELARYLLERARVAVVPGEAFGSAEHIRLSYAVPLERVREGMERIAEALATLARG